MIVATRELTLIRASRERKPVTLRLEAPVEDEHFWRCWYEIDWPEDAGQPAFTRRFYAGGEDAIQALQLGLMLLGAEGLATRAHKEQRLFWSDPGGGLGLAVPANLRHRLHGEVTAYYCDD